MTEVNKQAKPDYSDLTGLARKSLEIVKRNWKMFALVNIMAVVSALIPFQSGDKNDSMFSASYNGFPLNKAFNEGELAASVGLILFIAIVFIIVAAFLAAMSTSLMVRTSKGEQPNADVLTETAKKLWVRQVGLFIVMGLIILAGLILLIIPGIIAIIRLCMAPYIMFEKNLGIMDSIKASNELAKNNMGLVFGPIFIVILTGIVATVVSEIPYVGAIIGAIISVAFSMVIVLRYRELTSVPSSTTLR